MASTPPLAVQSYGTPTIDLCIVKALIEGISPGNRASPSVIGYARVISKHTSKRGKE